MIRAVVRIIEREIYPKVGCRFVIVEAYNQKDNTNFFGSLGFKEIPHKSIHSKSRRTEMKGKSIVLMIYDLKIKPESKEREPESSYHFPSL